MSYDENYNLLTVDHEDDTPDVFYDYDDADRVTQIEDGSGITLFRYGPSGRLLSVDGPLADDTITYGYDLLGRRSTLQSQKGQEINYVYDPLNRLEKVRLGTAEYIYGYGDQRTPLIASLTRPNGSRTTYDYDPLNRLLAITNQTSTGEIISKHAYTYNNQDLRDTETITGVLPAPALTEGLTESDYNRLNQLLSATNPTQSFSYDADGNMTMGYTPEGFLFTATYDAENRMHSIEYTDTDNHVRRRVYIYRWDGFLVRIEKYTDGTLVDDVRIVRDRLLALQDRESSNNVLREYTWGANLGGGIGGLLNLRQNGTDYSYLYDGKGNVGTVLDNTRAVVASYRYNAFGKLVNQAGTLDQPFRFSTKRYDEGTGLNYYGYRFYAPAIERWLSRDPLGEAGGINLYGFVQNDPVNFVDPLGLDTVTVYSGGTIHLGGGGVSFLGGIASDTNGRICVVSKICGTVGPGVYGDLGFEIEGESTDLCEGESESEGAFAKGGDGIVTGGSVTGNSSGYSADAGFGGVGGGAAAGYISCKKTTICFN